MRRFGYFFVPMLIFIPLAALAFMLLWNWLAPEVFALGVITYWQSLGILILLRLLIGPRFGFPFYRSYGWFGHHRYRHFWKAKMYEKWKNMSDEDKEKFKEFYRYRYCGPHYSHASEPNETEQKSD